MIRLRALTALAVCLSVTASAPAGFITATNSTPGNFDASSGTRAVAFTGAEAGFDTGVITGLTVSINFAKADGEAFDPPFPTDGSPFFNEIVFRLTSPGGTTVNLITAGAFNTGSAGTLFDGVLTFDQSAAQVVNVNPNLVQAGTFRPVNDPVGNTLAAFNGQSAAGTFTLSIEDTVGADSLRFRSFTVNVTTRDGVSPVPAPPAAALALMGLLSAGGLARLRRRAV